MAVLAKQIACVGSGGVASSLLPALCGAGYKVVQVCSRTLEHAQRLARAVGATAHSNLSELNPNADMYIVAVPDSEIENVLRNANFGNGLVVHTAGSTPMSVFEKYNVKRYGVLYPLQTFSRRRIVDFAHVPLLVEGGTAQDVEELICIARNLSKNVQQVNSEKRMLLHIAAVFACNFSNHMLAVSAQLTRELGLEFDLLKPLIRETFEKALSAENPAEVQTGPAVRGDVNTVQKHIKALEKYPLWQQIYRLVSESIAFKTATPE